jgi:hypothetical protein
MNVLDLLRLILLPIWSKVSTGQSDMFPTAQMEVDSKSRLSSLNRFKIELMDDFDFVSWAMLARTAPNDFEQRRRDVIESQLE